MKLKQYIINLIVTYPPTMKLKQNQTGNDEMATSIVCESEAADEIKQNTG